MSEQRPPVSRIVTALIAGAFVIGTAVATALIYLIWQLAGGAGWQEYSWPRDLTLRILWGCCVVAVAATLLTRLTIIGWHLRRYFRPAEQSTPQRDPVSGGPRRPARAPWYKSGALSFSMTVTLVSLTGATAIASAVIWIMGDVFGDWLMWLILKIIWGVYWIAVIAIVLTRIGVFRLHMLKAKQAAAAPKEQPKQSPDQITP
jgi:hypothetical protein